jgi:hypothetical protein
VTFEHYAEANVLDNLRTLCLSCHKRAEWAYWRDHPAMLRFYPDPRRIHTCRTCGRDYLAKGHRSLYCGDCKRPSRRAPSDRAARTPSPAARRSDHPEAAAS